MTKSLATPSRWLRWQDTHLRAPLWLFKTTIKDADHEALRRGENHARRSFVRKFALRSLWFWPTVDDAVGWAEAEIDGHWSPKKYLREKPARPAQHVTDVLLRSETLMELACDSGCDLNFPYQAEFFDLTAVGVSGTVLATFKELLPEAWASASVSHGLLQRYLSAQAAKSVGTIYSNDAALELVHTSFLVVKEVSRVARHGVILELDPRSIFYPRDYIG